MFKSLLSLVFFIFDNAVAADRFSPDAESWSALPRDLGLPRATQP